VHVTTTCFTKRLKLPVETSLIRCDLVEGKAIGAYLRCADPLVLCAIPHCQRGVVTIYHVSSYRDRWVSNFLVPGSFYVKRLRGNCTTVNFISLLKPRVITFSCTVLRVLAVPLRQLQNERTLIRLYDFARNACTRDFNRRFTVFRLRWRVLHGDSRGWTFRFYWSAGNWERIERSMVAR